MTPPTAQGEAGRLGRPAQVLAEEPGDPLDGEIHVLLRLVGDLTLECDTWSSPDGSGQRLMVLTAEPGSPSHDALRILTSWAPGQPSGSLSSAPR
ncbi:hypothetical protein [Nonomuraea sp. NPDC049709]|uniref:MmyB family transcriptional regulator n=1 Tax=Nonomuraea sp. NPDC049709 TaxID=3154736 RepID=UPI0034245E75